MRECNHTSVDTYCLYIQAVDTLRIRNGPDRRSVYTGVWARGLYIHAVPTVAYTERMDGQAVVTDATTPCMDRQAVYTPCHYGCMSIHSVYTAVCPYICRGKCLYIHSVSTTVCPYNYLSRRLPLQPGGGGLFRGRGQGTSLTNPLFFLNFSYTLSQTLF